MKILVKAKHQFKIIESKDFEEMKMAFEKMIKKYDIKVEFRNFKILYEKN